MNDAAGEKFGLYLSPVHDCSYLEGRSAQTLFVDPAIMPGLDSYTALSRHGFRRSGDFLYKPACPACNACVPLRIPVAEFSRDRGQRRIWARNSDLEVVPVPPAFDPEHFALYQRYVRARHPGGGMDEANEQAYMNFLTSRWSDTTFFEFRAGAELLAIAIVDRLRDAYSAVYTFFAPEKPGRSLGTHAILWQIQAAREDGLDWVYLGYWIESCRKMSYKSRFLPCEMLTSSGWHRLAARDTGAS